MPTVSCDGILLHPIRIDGMQFQRVGILHLIHVAPLCPGVYIVPCGIRVVPGVTDAHTPEPLTKFPNPHARG